MAAVTPSVAAMRTRSHAAQHDAAVARRLELLTTELAAVRERDARPQVPVPAPVSWGRRGRPDRHEADVDHVDEARSPQGPVPSTARLPGRHASRRTTMGGSSPWSELLPEGLRGRVVLGPAQVAVVAVVAAVGLALTCWWLLRSGAHEVSAPTALTTPGADLVTPAAQTVAAQTVATQTVASQSAASQTAAHPPSASGPTPPAGTAQVVVDVAGKVRRPGIVVLRQGSRVVDALRAAGGARPGVDLGALNLARVLTDGEQIVVGSTSAAGPPVSSPPTGMPSTGMVDINTADETTLESLPEVGPVTAQAILAWRTQHGGFTSVDQLLDVEGIGDATLAKLKPYVTL
jgi:competence protein ComEA